MHSSGLTNSIHDAQGQLLPEYLNGNPQVDDDFDGIIHSRVILHTDQQTFKLVLDFDESYRLFSADGVKLVVCNGRQQQIPRSLEDVQAFWLGGEDLVGKHTIACFQEWDPSNGRRTGAAPLDLPGPATAADSAVAPTYFQRTFNANKGCITIFIVRGRMSDDPDSDVEYKGCRSATDPPRDDMNRHVGKARCICWEHFSPLGGVNGKPEVFEFRVMAAHDTNALNLQQVETNYGSLAVSDTEDWEAGSSENGSQSADSLDSSSDSSSAPTDDGSGEYAPPRIRRSICRTTSRSLFTGEALTQHTATFPEREQDGTPAGVQAQEDFGCIRASPPATEVPQASGLVSAPKARATGVRDAEQASPVVEQASPDHQQATPAATDSGTVINAANTAAASSAQAPEVIDLSADDDTTTIKREPPSPQDRAKGEKRKAEAEEEEEEDDEEDLKLQIERIDLQLRLRAAQKRKKTEGKAKESMK